MKRGEGGEGGDGGKGTVEEEETTSSGGVSKGDGRTSVFNLDFMGIELLCGTDIEEEQYIR